MIILITGARGFIGSHLKLSLDNISEYKVYGTTSQLKSNNNEVTCELSNYKNVFHCLSELKPNVIFHLAGSFSNDFNTDLNNNVISTYNILKATHALGNETRIISTGSAAEYGFVSPEENPISESHHTCPTSIYGLTKLYQTLLNLLYAQTKNVDVVIARIFNIYGSGISEKLFPGKLDKQINDYKAGKIKKIEIRNPTAIRDYIHVNQVVDNLIKLIKYGLKGEIYNIGTGIGTDILSLTRKQLCAAGLDDSILEIIDDNPSSDYFDLKQIYANVNKFNSL